MVLIFNFLIRYGFRLRESLSSGFIFGLVMSIVLVSIHLIMLKSMGVQEMTKENLDIHQGKSIRSNLTLKELEEKIKSERFFGSSKFKETENSISFKTKSTWRSFGEKILITQSASDQGQIKYEVSSNPRLITTLVDFGKDLENVNRIEEIMLNVGGK